MSGAGRLCGFRGAAGPADCKCGKGMKGTNSRQQQGAEAACCRARCHLQGAAAGMRWGCCRPGQPGAGLSRAGPTGPACCLLTSLSFHAACCALRTAGLHGALPAVPGPGGCGEVCGAGAAARADPHAAGAGLVPVAVERGEHCESRGERGRGGVLCSVVCAFGGSVMLAVLLASVPRQLQEGGGSVQGVRLAAVACLPCGQCLAPSTKALCLVAASRHTRFSRRLSPKASIPTPPSPHPPARDHPADHRCHHHGAAARKHRRLRCGPVGGGAGGCGGHLQALPRPQHQRLSPGYSERPARLSLECTGRPRRQAWPEHATSPALARHGLCRQRVCWPCGPVASWRWPGPILKFQSQLCAPVCAAQSAFK